jgi:hypothetical protein
VAIAGIGAIADYLEDVIHLRHLREYDKKPPPARVLRGRIATKIKMGACIVGMFGFVAAVALLGLLQCYRALARAFPCLDSDQLRPYLPPACHSVPAIFGLAAAFVAVILAYGTVRAFLEPPEQTPP